MSQQKEPLLKVTDLKQYFFVNRHTTVKAVNGVSFQIHQGTTYGLVGESGSGKSTIGRSLIRLYDPTAGEILFNNTVISGRLDTKKRKMVTTGMQMIFQDPMACLNPREKVMDIIAQGLDIHHLYASREERSEKVYHMMERVGLSKEFATRYPHMFSGGQRQRIGIARALIMEPKLIIADEAISALDVSIQAQVVNLMKQLQKELDMTYLFIAHDLSMVKYISQMIGILHYGYLVEEGTSEEIFTHPVHPYTKSLISAIPQPNPLSERKRRVFVYDYVKSGISYENGQDHYISPTHRVLATDQEFESWMS